MYRYLTVLIVILIFIFSTALHAQSVRPQCLAASSDPDGDGYGFENGNTCVVAQISQSGVAETAQCIDDDNDGWGWNGVTSCQVPVTASVCVDTDPVGDGWGWDGTQSCRVEPATAMPVVGSPATGVSATATNENDSLDELAIIRSKFGVREDRFFPGSNGMGVAIRCPSGGIFSEEIFFLRHNGELRTFDGTGMWSSGWDGSDGLMRFERQRFGDGGAISVTTLMISNTIVEINGGRVCEWL